MRRYKCMAEAESSSWATARHRYRSIDLYCDSCEKVQSGNCVDSPGGIPRRAFACASPGQFPNGFLLFSCSSLLFPAVFVLSH